jgi:hypothetical protein
MKLKRLLILISGSLMIVIIITIIIPGILTIQHLPSWYPWLFTMDVYPRPSKKYISEENMIFLNFQLELYSLDNIQLPKTEEELNDIILELRLPNIRSMKLLRFIKRIPSAYRDPDKPLKEGIYWFDGWERPLRYKYLGKNNKGEESFMLYSYGPNGKDDSGKNDDIAKTESIPIEDKSDKSQK